MHSLALNIKDVFVLAVMFDPMSVYYGSKPLRIILASSRFLRAVNMAVNYPIGYHEDCKPIGGYKGHMPNNSRLPRSTTNQQSVAWVNYRTAIDYIKTTTNNNPLH